MDRKPTAKPGERVQTKFTTGNVLGGILTGCATHDLVVTDKHGRTVRDQHLLGLVAEGMLWRSR